MDNLDNFLPVYLLFLEGIRDNDLSLDSKVLALAQARLIPLSQVSLV